MKSDFLIAVTQLAAERNLPREVVLSAIEAALISVYKKDSLAAGQNLSVKILPNTGEVRVYTLKTVVEDVEDYNHQIGQKEATKYKADAKLGDIVEIEATPQFAGRIAAQTAKQVVMQRLREAERELVFEQFADREGDLLNAVVQRVEPRQVVLDIDKTEAVMPTNEMVPTERYRTGQRLKVLLLEVNRSPKGPQLMVSRASKNLVSRLFEMEVPEIHNGTVEIRSIAREPGYRSKVAVSARQEGVDPVGSCVGLRGIRIQNIVNELHGEKIDVIQWDKDPSAYIANALSPAQVARVEVEREAQTALVVVPDRHLSLAIGKEGQNARLAARLTGWRIDIRGASEVEEDRLRTAAAAVSQSASKEDAKAEVKGTLALEEAPIPVTAAQEPSAVAAKEVETTAEVGPETIATDRPQIEAEEPAPTEEIAIEEDAVEEVAREEEEAVATRSIEEIWPDTETPRRPATELRFAEDLNVPLPGRTKSKKRKAKKRGPEESSEKGSKGRKTKSTAVAYEDEED